MKNNKFKIIKINCLIRVINNLKLMTLVIVQIQNDKINYNTNFKIL